MHPPSTASLRVASSSFAVMKMTGHFDPDAASRRRSSIPEIPPRWMSSSRQVPVCALPLSSNASAEANVRLSMPLCANSRATPFRKPCGVRIEGQSSQVEVGLFVCSCAGAAGVAEIVATPTRISLYGDGERCGYPEECRLCYNLPMLQGGHLRGANYDQKHSYQSSAKNVTSTIPIVFFIGGDPVRLGLVASYNRPGGNVTGLILNSDEMTAKRL